MTNVPPLSDNVREFLGTIEAALDYVDLNLGVNFGLDFTDPHPEFGIGAMFCQLNVKRSRVSIKAAKETLVVVVTDGLFVWNELGQKQMLPFTPEQPPHRVAAMLAAAMITQKPIVAPQCPHCAEEEQHVLG
tara:strand:+ start:38 stop:433 length:396 start_codon:yes stop_codon:yes gene_type:complete